MKTAWTSLSSSSSSYLEPLLQLLQLCERLEATRAGKNPALVVHFALSHLRHTIDAVLLAVPEHRAHRVGRVADDLRPISALPKPSA